MRENRLTTILLIILIVVCVFQGCSISSMSSNIDELNNRLSNADNALQNLEYRVEELESVVQANVGIDMDYSYEVSEIDWNTGNVLAQFTIVMGNVTEDTRILVKVGQNTFELTGEGNVFKGTVEYPMTKSSYETIVYQYEGDMEKANETLDWISAGSLLQDKMSCKFDGFIAYGNGKLTMAGDLHYGFNMDDTIVSAKFVLENTTKEVSANKTGSYEINISEDMKTLLDKNGTDTRVAYMEFITESGITYQVYPEFGAYTNHQVNRYEDSEDVIVEVAGDDSNSIYQEAWIVAILPDGTTYEMVPYYVE